MKIYKDILLHEDYVNGYEFEHYIAGLLRRNGFATKTTPKVHDYGIDVLAQKDRVVYAVQCKLYSKPVGTVAVQEAFAGKAYYNAHVAIVATNNSFTRAAKELAKTVGVVLWDKQMLANLEVAAKRMDL